MIFNADTLPVLDARARQVGRHIQDLKTEQTAPTSNTLVDWSDGGNRLVIDLVGQIATVSAEVTHSVRGSNREVGSTYKAVLDIEQSAEGRDGTTLLEATISTNDRPTRFHSREKPDGSVGAVVLDAIKLVSTQMRHS